MPEMTSLSDSALPWETRKRETLYCTADTVAIITFIDDKIKSRNEKIKPFSNAKNEKVTWSPKDLFLSFVAFVCRYDLTTLSPCQLAVFFFNKFWKTGILQGNVPSNFTSSHVLVQQIDVVVG